MEEKRWYKYRHSRIMICIIIFLFIAFCYIEETSNKYKNDEIKQTSNNLKEGYKYVSYILLNNSKERIDKIVANKNITDEYAKEIFEELENKSSNYEKYSLWIFSNEENASKLKSYDIAEIKKENGEYKIHRYGEETEEEKAIKEEQERINKEIEEKKKEEEQLKKEEEEKIKKEQEEKDFKASCKTYTFKEIARNPETFKGTAVKLTGKVMQAMYGGYGTDLRVNITKQGSYSTYYTDTIYVSYYPKEGEGKILEDDIITIWGTSYGDTSYTSTMGATITLPHISAKCIEIN